jgi:hypothetical protein
MAERTVDPELVALVRAIVTGDSTRAVRMLADSPALASARFAVGARRQVEEPYYLRQIGGYFYAGDTALHIAAAAYQIDVLDELLVRGANVHAKNRRGAEPLHAAATGVQGSARWNPSAQAEQTEIVHLVQQCGATRQ